MNNEIVGELGNLVKAGNGKIHTGPFGSQLHASDYVEEGIPCIMPANMKNSRVDLTNISYISELDAKRLSKYIVKENDIVYSRRGDVTQKALIRQSEAGYFCGTGCLLLRPGDKFDSRFLTYYLSTSEMQKWIVSQAVGATMPNLNTGILSRLPFVGPEKSFQKKIADVLSAIENKIELTNKINTELETMAKTLYDYWFVQFDFPDAEGKPYKSSGGKMVYNETLEREIPEGWDGFSVSDLVNIKTGKEDANFAVEHGEYHFFTCGETNLRCDSYVFDGKAILLAGNGSFSVKKYQGKFNAYQRTYVLMPEDSLFAILYFAVKDRVTSFISGSRGSIVKFITKGDIESICIPLPKDKNLEFAKILNALLDKSSFLYEESIKLEGLRDWLLPMLMNGQVTVSQ